MRSICQNEQLQQHRQNAANRDVDNVNDVIVQLLVKRKKIIQLWAQTGGTYCGKNAETSQNERSYQISHFWEIDLRKVDWIRMSWQRDYCTTIAVQYQKSKWNRIVVIKGQLQDISEIARDQVKLGAELDSGKNLGEDE